MEIFVLKFTKNKYSSEIQYKGSNEKKERESPLDNSVKGIGEEIFPHFETFRNNSTELLVRTGGNCTVRY